MRHINGQLPEKYGGSSTAVVVIPLRKFHLPILKLFIRQWRDIIMNVADKDNKEIKLYQFIHLQSAIFVV